MILQASQTFWVDSGMELLCQLTSKVKISVKLHRGAHKYWKKSKQPSFKWDIFQFLSQHSQGSYDILVDPEMEDEKDNTHKDLYSRFGPVLVLRYSKHVISFDVCGIASG